MQNIIRRGPASSFEFKRRKGVRLVFEEGINQREAARQLDVNERTVRRWIEAFRKYGEKGLAPHKKTGRPWKIHGQQKVRLLKLLLRGAQALGFETNLWTCPRIAHVIHRQFGISYHIDHIGRLLRSLGWSPQKPERRALERDEKRIAGWVRSTWPRIKKNRTRGALPSYS